MMNKNGLLNIFQSKTSQDNFQIIQFKVLNFENKFKKT